MKTSSILFFGSLALLPFPVFGEETGSLANIEFGQLASQLGATTVGENCRYKKLDLTKIESDDFSSSNHFIFNQDKYAGDWSCINLKAHIKDDSLKDCTPNPSDVFQLSPDSPLKINGKEGYRAGGIPILNTPALKFNMPYQYEVSKDKENNLNVTVKIHFTGSILKDPSNKALVQVQLDKAAEVWSKQSPSGKMKFHFLSVEASEKPDFKVELKPKIHAHLYNSTWDFELFKAGYGANTIAHEIGHMMGIPDEYDPFRDDIWKVHNEVDSRRCNTRGMMCNSYVKKTYPYYYYLILRRAACALRDQSPSQKETVEKSLDVMSEVQAVTKGPTVDCEPETEAPPKKKRSKFLDYLRRLFQRSKND